MSGSGLIKDLVGLELGTCTVVAQAPGRASAGCLLWRCRCSACGEERVVTGNHLNKLRAKGRALACPRCLNRVTRCNLCRQQGHMTAACPLRRAKVVCEVCGSLPHRVVGIRCKVCRLRYEAEPVEGIDYGARNPSALARMMGGGS